MVDRAKVAPPRSSLSLLTADEISRVVQNSLLFGAYEKTVDRESAYEKLKQKAEQSASTEPLPSPGRASGSERSGTADLLGAFAKSAAHAIGSQVGRQIIRGILGSISGSGRRR
jgi:hypothetical protein